jgi:hypothetical protein
MATSRACEERGSLSTFPRGHDAPRKSEPVQRLRAGAPGDRDPISRIVLRLRGMPRNASSGELCGEAVATRGLACSETAPCYHLAEPLVRFALVSGSFVRARGVEHDRDPQRLIELRLDAFEKARIQQQADPEIERRSFDERLALLVDAEFLDRHNKRLARNLREVKLRIGQACLEELDYAPVPQPSRLPPQPRPRRAHRGRPGSGDRRASTSPL